MESIWGSSNLNEGNLVMSTPLPPPYCLATFSNSVVNSFSRSGVGSTRLLPLQKKNVYLVEPLSKILKTLELD